MTGSGGVSSTPRLLGSITDSRNTGSPAFAGDVSWEVARARIHQTHLRIPAARCARVMPEPSALKKSKGVRNAGCPTHPQPGGQEKNSRTSIVTTNTPGSPGAPHTMVYGLFRALPGDRAFLSPSFAKFRKLDAGVEASGPHGFTVRRLRRSSRAIWRARRRPRPPHPAPRP
jgi:hypothetical protein